MKHSSKHKLVLFFFLIFLMSSACSQHSKTVNVESKDSISAPRKDTLDFNVEYTELGKGVYYAESDAPYKSILGDSKLTILKIEKSRIKASLFCATEHSKTIKTAEEWGVENNMQIVFNAGMYDISKPLISRGQLIKKKHVNQSKLKNDYNSMIVLNPKDSLNSSIDIIDLEFQKIQKYRYRSFAQGLRMIDSKGKAMNWKKKKQSCSMLVCAEDNLGNFYLFFTRSPYLHNTMIDILKQFPEPLSNAIYMEGGPETSLYVRIGEFELNKVGSYVSETYENDNNTEFWKLPNVIGIQVEEK
jgi:hypothetical protein